VELRGQKSENALVMRREIPIVKLDW